MDRWIGARWGGFGYDSVMTCDLHPAEIVELSRAGHKEDQIAGYVGVKQPHFRKQIIRWRPQITYVMRLAYAAYCADRADQAKGSDQYAAWMRRGARAQRLAMKALERGKQQGRMPPLERRRRRKRGPLLFVEDGQTVLDL